MLFSELFYILKSGRSLVQKVKNKMGVGKWYLELFKVKHIEVKSSLICQYLKINTVKMYMH
jgi:hypothetical protein